MSKRERKSTAAEAAQFKLTDFSTANKRRLSPREMRALSMIGNGGSVEQVSRVTGIPVAVLCDIADLDPREFREEARRVEAARYDITSNPVRGDLGRPARRQDPATFNPITRRP